VTRALLTLLAVLALVPATASATTTTAAPDIYGYGVDAYLACIGDSRTVTHQVACANELALDLTDGGQLRRAPICLRNRTTEWVSGENRDLVRTAANCVEQYLGTGILSALPRVAVPPPGL
jgi:hypothetical protein